MHHDRRDERDAPGADGPLPGSNPAPEDIHGVPDATLGGYLDTHDRPPAFEGADGHPYTVSLEVEQTPDLRAPLRRLPGVSRAGPPPGSAWLGTCRRPCSAANPGEPPPKDIFASCRSTG